MNEYLLSIIGIVLLSAVFTGILPEGKTAGLIKSVMRMACILAIISPIITFFRGEVFTTSGINNSKQFFSEVVIEMDSSFIHYNSEMRIAETENAIEQELFNRFLMQTDVKLLWEAQTEKVGKTEAADIIKITQIRVKVIEQQEEEGIRQMWEYLMKNYCSEVLIE